MREEAVFYAFPRALSNVLFEHLCEFIFIFNMLKIWYHDTALFWPFFSRCGKPLDRRAVKSQHMQHFLMPVHRMI